MKCFIDKDDLGKIIPMYRHVVLDCNSGYLILDVETYQLITKESANIINEGHLADGIFKGNKDLLELYRKLREDVKDENLKSLLGIIGFIKTNILPLDTISIMNILLDIVSHQPISSIYQKKSQLIGRIEITGLMLEDIDRYLSSITSTLESLQKETLQTIVDMIVKQGLLPVPETKVVHIQKEEHTQAIIVGGEVAPKIETVPSVVPEVVKADVVIPENKPAAPAAVAPPVEEKKSTGPISMDDALEEQLNKMEFSFALKPVVKKDKSKRAEPVLESKESTQALQEEEDEINSMIKDFL